MTRSTPALLALAVLALPGLAVGQDDPRLARTAEAYGAKAWPAPGPARLGVSPRAIAAPGWTARGFEVDPRRGEGALRLREEKAGAEVVVAARVLATPADARAALLRELAAGQRVLEPVAGVGEVAFGGGTKATLHLLHAVRGNVLMEVRAVARSEALGPEAVVTLAMALDALVLGAPPLEPGQAAGPRLLGVRVAPARVGAPAAVALDLDPAGDAAAHVVFECSGGASVVQTDAGWELFAPEPGRVKLTVWAASKELRVATAEVVVEVAP